MKLYCYVELENGDFTGFTMNAVSLNHASDKLWYYFGYNHCEPQQVAVQIKSPKVNYTDGHITLSRDNRKVTKGEFEWHNLEDVSR